MVTRDCPCREGGRKGGIVLSAMGSRDCPCEGGREGGREGSVGDGGRMVRLQETAHVREGEREGGRMVRLQETSRGMEGRGEGSTLTRTALDTDGGRDEGERFFCHCCILQSSHKCSGLGSVGLAG